MIYVSGDTGQLGFELKQILGDQAIFLNRHQLDVSDLSQVESFFNNNKVSCFINTAAYTLVDKAEAEQDLAKKINSTSPALISSLSKKYGFKFIHFSTDYVFSGNHFVPYMEEDIKNPVNFYGSTKAEGEDAILRENPNSLIFRTSWLYSSYGKNFLNTIIRLASERSVLNIVYDQVGTPTYAAELAMVTLKSKDLSGIYHFSNEGVCSWYDFAIEIKKNLNLKCDINPILSSEYPTPAKRPNYSVLNKNKIKSDLGIKIPHWTESLELCLKKRF